METLEMVFLCDVWVDVSLQIWLKSYHINVTTMEILLLHWFRKYIDRFRYISIKMKQIKEILEWEVILLSLSLWYFRFQSTKYENLSCKSFSKYFLFYLFYICHNIPILKAYLDTSISSIVRIWSVQNCRTWYMLQ